MVLSTLITIILTYVVVILGIGILATLVFLWRAVPMLRSGKTVELILERTPPTNKQVEVMAQVVAAICKGKGWEPTVDRVKTHAEWADIDGYGIHDDDPDMRWDLLKLPQEEGNGGDIIRGKANWYLARY